MRRTYDALDQGALWFFARVVYFLPDANAFLSTEITEQARSLPRPCKIAVSGYVFLSTDRAGIGDFDGRADAWMPLRGVRIDGSARQTDEAFGAAGIRGAQRGDRHDAGFPFPGHARRDGPAGRGDLHPRARRSHSGARRRARIQPEAENRGADPCVCGNAGDAEAPVRLYFRETNARRYGSADRDARHRRAVRVVRREARADPGDARDATGAGIQAGQRGVPDGFQRRAGRVEGIAAGVGAFYFGRAALHVSSDSFECGAIAGAGR